MSSPVETQLVKDRTKQTVDEKTKIETVAEDKGPQQFKCPSCGDFPIDYHRHVTACMGRAKLYESRAGLIPMAQSQ